MVNEQVSKLFPEAERSSIYPLKDVISLEALILVLSRPSRISWKPQFGIEMEGHETAAGTSASGSPCMTLSILQKRNRAATACVYVHELGTTTLKGQVRFAFPRLNLVLKPQFFHSCLSTITVLTVSVYVLENH